MENQNTTITLDDRIRKDLEDLYNSGILKFIEQFKNCKIKEAEELSMNLFGTPNEISTHGLPGYFAGEREAKTVMVMLNPGVDSISHDNPFVTEETLKKQSIMTGTIDDFFNSYKDGSKNYGDLDLDDKGEIRIDNFDIKQAAFLKAWDECGVKIPDGFPDRLKNLSSNPSKEEKEERDKLLREAKRNVLMQKLQLDLIPYASREFKKIEKGKMHFLFPYIDSIFGEIFSCERKYVIFCSDFFDTLFRMYSDDKEHTGNIDFGERKEKALFQNDRKAYCTPIKITYDKGEAMTSIHAVIAHTFPNKALPNAYDKMKEYGEFCFKEYNKYKNLNP